MQKYTIDPHGTERQVVGFLNATVLNSLLGTNLPDAEVIMYPGFVKHVRKKHPGIFENHYDRIPDIIENPDFVGQNLKEPNSVELYKQVGPLLLAIKLDPTGYLYLSSMYDLHNGQHKIQKRLQSGRIIPYPKGS
ncbi:MAG: PBECR3 domain-containing polyvalent protein, partial [Tumebacillaceae bacterium]